MSEAFHKLVWIDHRSARLYDFTREALREAATISAPDRPGHLHHHAGTPGPGHAAPDHHYFKAVADAMAGARAILIVGPGDAKGQFSHFIRDHRPELRVRILGVEPCGNIGGGELHMFARRLFARLDRMTAK